MKKLLEIFKKPHWLLCLGLGIVLVASLFANIANTSFWSVSVKEVDFITYNADGTEKGEIHGLVYRPRKCTAKNPCATVVTTHGYLNTKEMQDAPAVELSKRGYVVVAIDMYAHGDSYYIDETQSSWGFTTALYDAVKEIYTYDYVLKAADGTGIIGVSGHSMGASAAGSAVTSDFADGGDQMIVAMLAVANSTASASAINARNTNKVTSGTIAAHYDEFFFPPDNASSDADYFVRKDWVKTKAGSQFYYGDSSITAATNDFEAGEWNEESYGGAGSVIYTPNEIHPWNHFSTETTSYIIEFFDKAFETQIGLRNVTADDGVVSYKAGSGQTWWLKEGFNFVALLGVFLSIVAAIALFAKLPFFGRVVTAEGEINEVSTSKTTGGKWLSRGLLFLSSFAVVWVYPMMNLGKAEALEPFNKALYGLMWGSGLILVLLVVAGVIVKSLKNDDEKALDVVKSTAYAVVGVFVASFFAYWTMTRDFFINSQFYSQPGTNTIAKWVTVAAPLTLVGLALSHAISNKNSGYTAANYGLKAGFKQVLFALLIAVIVVTGVYSVTFLVEALLKVDFRIWTYAIKPFGSQHFVLFLRYLPAFFLFYLVNAISVVANTGHDKTWKGTFKAILINALGLVLLVAVQYGTWFATGRSKWNLALPIIYVFAIIPTMIFAAWIARKSYAKTGNIWTAVFINTLLFTLMQVANTYISYYMPLSMFQ